MVERRYVGRQGRESAADSQGRTSRALPLPADLLRQASRRLEITALIGAALWVLAPGLGHVAQHLAASGDSPWFVFQRFDAIAASGIVVSLAVFFYLRSGERDPALIVNLALWYMIATAFDLGVLVHWGPPPGAPTSVSPTITWIGPIILIFAAIVPVPPWKMFAAGLVAASMDPLGMIVAQALGSYHFGPLRNAFLMHYPNYLLLGVAVVISTVVTRLGQQVTREREMGSYRLGELLGRGGMGEVYRATHRMLARPAAVKLIRPEVLASGDGGTVQTAIARFRREAEVASTLRSPHTVELYDFGVTSDQTLYFAMEFLEGMDLETLVREHGPVPAARAVHILRQVCESLEEAHAAGLVHRDIKPANIHVGRLGLRHDWVKVLDFGLVKSASGARQGDSLATAAGLTPGTPAYMAPEIALQETVDGRADLYALGCVAYHMLTGRLVFEAATAFQQVAKHIQEQPAPLSARTQAPVVPALERVVLACLAKRPDERPASAAELDRMLAESGVGPWTEADARAWWSNRLEFPPAAE
jgi:serine/threonine-protein kinase